MSADDIKWIIILAVLGVAELVALLTARRGDTLSEFTWRWFKVGQKVTWKTALLRLPLAVFLVWLAGHLTLGIWTL